MSFDRIIGRAERRQLDRDNAKLPDRLALVPRHEWPPGMDTPSRLHVWRSRRFLVQALKPLHPLVMLRLTVNRTEVDPRTQRWLDGITWDELQTIKRETGFGDFEAVEVYPADVEVVNDANMRHLWVLHERLPFGWKASGGPR